MLQKRDYNRLSAVEYARLWAYRRNPEYSDFDGMGGDCTNFISQCIFAGSNIMNYTPVTGWYYKNLFQRTASWSGVENLYYFLTTNTGAGPYGIICNRDTALIGDVIQLYRGNTFTHSLLITAKRRNEIFVSAHTYDTFNQNLDSYIRKDTRYIHIEKVQF
jgi:hypothetical protein